jgi:hypothetical protein
MRGLRFALGALLAGLAGRSFLNAGAPHEIELRQGSLRIVVSDGSDRGGYSGVSSITDSGQPRDIFIPRYGGMNLEVVQDGSLQPDEALFETRHSPIALRSIDAATAELDQPLTPHWGLESRTRFHLAADGVLEVDFECVPHKVAAGADHLCLSWANYIDGPESPDLHFREAGGWRVRPTPRRGVSTPHWALADRRDDTSAPGLSRRFPGFFALPKYRYSEPWFFGICRGRVLAFIFSPQDRIRLGEAHMEAGTPDPAWDFQWFIPRPRAGWRYRMAWRVLYFPAGDPRAAEARVARGADGMN